MGCLGAVRSCHLSAEAQRVADSIDELCSVVGKSPDQQVELTMRQQLAEMRTGEDAIAFFSRFGGNSGVKLLYCNLASPEGKSTNPWDLVIVPQHRVQPEHFTISANGVVHFRPGELSECTPLSVWVQQCMRFRVLTSMSFFRCFERRKLMCQWQDGVRQVVYNRCRQKLARRCFFAKPQFVGRLMKAKALASNLSEVAILQIPAQCCHLDEFADTHQNLLLHAVTGAQRELEQCQSAVEDVLEDLVSSVENAAATALAAAGRVSRPNSRKSVALEKQETKDMHRRQQIAQEDEQLLGRCIMLVDYISQSYLVTLAVSAAQRLHKTVVRTNGEHHRKLFYVSACLQNEGSSGGVVLEPPPASFDNAAAKLWTDIITVVDAVPRADNARRLARHAIADRAGQKVSEILEDEQTWQSCTHEIQKELRAQLTDLQVEATKVYEPYRKIHEFGLRWNELSFARTAHSYKSLSETMAHMSEFRDELNNIRIHRQLGVLLLDCKALKESLLPVPEKGLATMCPLMAVLAREQTTTFCSRAKHLIRELDKRPTERAALEDFAMLVKTASAEQRAVQASLDECLSMHRLLRQHGVRPSLDDQVMLDGFASKEREFSQESLPAAMAYLAQQRRRAEMELSYKEEMAFEVPATILVS